MKGRLMTATEQDIYSTPAILRQTLARVDERGAALAPLLQGPAVFLGCGSSYCIALAAAALYEDARSLPAQGIMASEYRPRPGWTHVAISRTGKTTELVEAMRRARAAGARVALVGGEAARAALRDLPDRIERALEAFDPAPLVPLGHVVFLGRSWRYGLALMAALNLQETALVVPEGHQTLEYRHGPIASADEGTLVWCFDPPDDAASAAVLDDVRRTGATVRCTDDDPLVVAAQAQLLPVRVAQARGVDPDAPRHLRRAIVLPSTQ